MVKGIKRRHLVKEYYEKTRSISAFSLYPNIEDRKAYEGFAPELKKELIKAGEKAMEEPWSVIHLSDYLEFSENGNRERFESLYFSRRRKLCSLIMAELTENNGKFVPDILDGIYLILEESSWCLPAHNTHIRDASQQVFPDTAAPIIDLFAAETGALMAFAEYLLRPVLEKRSPLISKSIDKALTERIFTPYRFEHFWWMGDGEQDMCNWTPWCTQNVLLSVFLLPFNDDIRFKVIKQAAYSLDCFLKDYGEDGCCDEGAQYYRHAGLCLFHCIDILNTVTDNALRDLNEFKRFAAFKGAFTNTRNAFRNIDRIK